MSYFAPFIDASGLHLPTYEDRLSNLCEAYQSIFGQDAHLEAGVPDYQLLSVFSKALDDVSALVLQAYNSRNPAYAQGQALDLLLPQYGLARRGATKSRATVTVTGSSGTVVPQGTAFGDTKGRLWKTLASTSIGSSGTRDVVTECQTPGAEYAAAGTITSIISSVAGLTGVTNAAGSTTGLNEETDAEVRKRISAAMAGRGATIIDSMYSALMDIANVRSVKIYVNDTSATDANGIPAHAIAVVILGGNVTQIGKTIWEQKAPGIPTYGSNTVTFTDDNNVSHSVSYSRPASRLTYFMVSLTQLAGFDQAAVEEAIAGAITEAVGEVPIGESLNIPAMFGRCYAAAGSLASTFVLRSIQASAAATELSPAVTTTELLTQAWKERIAIPSSNGIQFTYT